MFPAPQRRVTFFAFCFSRTANEAGRGSCERVELSTRGLRTSACSQLSLDVCARRGVHVCAGTLAPPNPTAEHMECNYCGASRTDAEFFQMLEDL
eukprot:5892846-Pyramimonas_sp.AAC.1